MTLHFNEYQYTADGFAKQTARSEYYYLLPGLAGEVGELCSLYAKSWRDGTGGLDRTTVIKELGDILWFVSELAHVQGISLLEVAEANIKKLASRQERGTIGGSGDDR
jgi:NTP pyrophosphatase (non-canonical NTP hydrolase)